MNLNPKLFDADVEQAPIRQGFGEGLVIAGRADERVDGSQIVRSPAARAPTMSWERSTIIQLSSAPIPYF